MKRRKFIKSSISGALGMGLLTGFYTWQIEPFWLEFVHMKMPIQNLPDDLVGKSLMHISDIHVGNGFDYNYIIESFGKAKLFNPDFVVYTGDFVSYVDERQFQQLEEVLKHTVRGKLGTIGILGNHDYGHNWAEQSVATQIESQLQLAEIDLLNNQQLEKNGLNFIGFDDFWGPNFVLKK